MSEGESHFIEALKQKIQQELSENEANTHKLESALSTELEASLSNEHVDKIGVFFQKVGLNQRVVEKNNTLEYKQACLRSLHSFPSEVLDQTMDDLRHKRQLLLTIKKLNDLVTQSKEERSNLSLQITVLTELNTIRLEISQLFGMLTSKLIDDFPLLNQTSRITNDIVALIQQEIERIYEVGIQDAETTLVIDLSKLREAEAILRSFTQIAGTQQKEEHGIGHRLSEKLSKFIVRGTLMDVNVTLDVILSENVVSVNLSAPHEKSGKHLVQMIGNVNKCIIGYQNLTSYLRDVLSLGDEEVEAMWKKFGHELELSLIHI
eukprot:TRINITY_DN2479_c0_g4_i4.p1 TRINITY_DN2479_c0_g4~~TRINITY_DN2479_c0_g4_i4.p1  ORF type:complete len:320 (-),score=66.73 TRINITY_DN2479_c0_g4_i4:61-1020(-)